MMPSVTECLKYYEKEVKERRYTYQGFSGMKPDRCIGQIYKVVADLSEDNKCSDIVIYAVGAAMKAEHFHGGGIDITDAVVDYLQDLIDWEEMLQSICDIINDALGFFTKA